MIFFLIMLTKAHDVKAFFGVGLPTISIPLKLVE